MNFFAFAVLIAVLVPTLISGGHVLYLLRQFYWASEEARRYALCPACHSRIELTRFKCNHCSTVNELIPTEKEIFYTQCSGCGTRLPKLPRLGREGLIAICSNENCGFPIGKNAGKYREVAIPFLGNTSTGKTAFLTAWTVYAQTQLIRDYPVKLSFPFPGGDEFAKKCRTLFATGDNVDRTHERTPLGLGMDIVPKNGTNGLRVYFYDPAGEVFDYGPNSLQHFHYYDFMEGCIFLIDPFATPELRDRYDTASVGMVASEKSIEDSCEKFIRGLYEHNLARNEYHYAYCAVVITKADAIVSTKAKDGMLDLDSQIGNKAVQKEVSNDPSLDYEDVLSEICEQKLQQWGVGHVMQLLNEHFKEVRYFSVSAFGHPPQKGVPFAPQRIELPILWLLRKQRSNLFT
jgi:hypothetical protein